MGEGTASAGRLDGAGARGGAGSAATWRALELVATRGGAMIGMRHLLAGTKAWLGKGEASFVHVPMAGFGGAPRVLAQATSRALFVSVPPNARARLHGADGLGHILTGGARVTLMDGDSLVIVLGAIQIRARAVNVPTLRARSGAAGHTLAWVAALAVLYFAALVVCAWLTPHRAVAAPAPVPSGIAQ